MLSPNFNKVNRHQNHNKFVSKIRHHHTNYIHSKHRRKKQKCKRRHQMLTPFVTTVISYFLSLMVQIKIIEKLSKSYLLQFIAPNTINDTFYSIKLLKGQVITRSDLDSVSTSQSPTYITKSNVTDDGSIHVRSPSTFTINFHVSTAFRDKIPTPISYTIANTTHHFTKLQQAELQDLLFIIDTHCAQSLHSKNIRAVTASALSVFKDLDCPLTEKEAGLVRSECITNRLKEITQFNDTLQLQLVDYFIGDCNVTLDPKIVQTIRIYTECYSLLEYEFMQEIECYCARLKAHKPKQLFTGWESYMIAYCDKMQIL